MGSMHNSNGTSILEHALEVATLARPLVEAIQRKDRDLASHVRRAVSSIALNVAEAQGNAGGNSRVRYEAHLGHCMKPRRVFALLLLGGTSHKLQRRRCLSL